jgi:hypothetical protein
MARTLGTSSTRSGSSGGRREAARETRLTDKRAPAGFSQPLGGFASDGPSGVVGWAELDPIPVRLLEVVADDLLVLGGALPGRLIEPAREAFVHLASSLLGDRLIGGVSNQEVAEAIRGASKTRTIGPD